MKRSRCVAGVPRGSRRHRRAAWTLKSEDQTAGELVVFDFHDSRDQLANTTQYPDGAWKAHHKPPPPESGMSPSKVGLLGCGFICLCSTCKMFHPLTHMFGSVLWRVVYACFSPSVNQKEHSDVERGPQRVSCIGRKLFPVSRADPFRRCA